MSDFYVVVPTPVIELGPYCLAVYAVLRDHADKQTGEAFPSHRKIAARARLSVSKVQRSLTELRGTGWVEWQGRKGDDGSRSSNLYTVHGSPDPSVPQTDPSVPQTDPPRSAVPTPLGLTDRVTITQSLTNTHLELTGTTFADFWAVYPRRAGKRAAEIAWTKHVTDPVAVIEAARRFAADPSREPKFTPHPATWINGHRWLDDPLPTATAGVFAYGAVAWGEDS